MAMNSTTGRRIVTATLVAALAFTGVATASAADASPPSWLNLPAPEQPEPGGPPSGTPGGPPSHPPGPPTTPHGTPTATADAESAPARGPGNRPEGAGPPSGVTAAPAGAENRPENAGPPAGTGQGARPEAAGPPGGVGQAGFRRAPELPPQASDQARAAVTMAFERQALIADMVAQIRDIPPGPEKGAAVSEVVREFANVFRLMSEAIEAEDDADTVGNDDEVNGEEEDIEDESDADDEESADDTEAGETDEGE